MPQGRSAESHKHPSKDGQSERATKTLKFSTRKSSSALSTGLNPARKRLVLIIPSTDITFGDVGQKAVKKCKIKWRKKYSEK